MVRIASWVSLLLVVVACGGTAATTQTDSTLPPVDLDAFVSALAADGRPTVVNLWASWCIPCRSEAPLLREASTRFGDRVRFVGVATEDAPSDSIAFIHEFDLTFENFGDPAGAVKAWASAPGLPVTLFVLPGGEILRRHYGVIDDQTLALGIDDIMNG